MFHDSTCSHVMFSRLPSIKCKSWTIHSIDHNKRYKRCNVYVFGSFNHALKSHWLRMDKDIKFAVEQRFHQQSREFSFLFQLYLLLPPPPPPFCLTLHSVCLLSFYPISPYWLPYIIPYLILLVCPLIFWMAVHSASSFVSSQMNSVHK